MSATAQRSNGRPRVPLMQPVAGPPPAAAAVPAVSTMNLDAAVLRVQAQAPALVRNAIGQVGSRSYGYVTLSAVIDVVLPLLVAEELLWKTWPTALDDGRPALRYRMTHLPSGESDEDTMPLPCDQTMQGLGSGITCGRRYALTAYLNLTIDEDDDGASANTGRMTASPAATPAVIPAATTENAPRPNQPTASAPKGGGRPATVKQRNMIRAKARDAGLTAGQLADIVLVATGNERRQMDEEAAERWLKMALERLPGAAVDAVVAGIEQEPPF